MVLERIRIIIKWLIGQGLADTQEGIGLLLGYTNKSSFSQILNGKKQLPTSFIERIASLNQKVNKVWIETGEGEMLNGATIEIQNQVEKPYLITSAGIKYYQRTGGKFLMRVPIVPIYAYAKYIDEIRDAEIWEGDGYFDFPVDQIYHGSYQAFEIKGDSMDDDSKRSLSHGDIVNARELSSDKWKDKLHTEKYPNWIIVTHNTILCKQIVKQDLLTGNIICHSLNPSPEYADFLINLNDVVKLFNIVQRVSSNF